MKASSREAYCKPQRAYSKLRKAYSKPKRAYSRKGDSGYTHDCAGRRLRKDDIRIICWGKIDELQAIVDLAILQSTGKTKAFLNSIQRKLWQTAGEMAGHPCATEPVNEQDLQQLEKFIDGLGAPPDHFIRLNTVKAIVLNECRVRCRNFERSMVGMLRKKAIRPVVYKYINRLSSLFFMLAYRKVKGETSYLSKERRGETVYLKNVEREKR